MRVIPIIIVAVIIMSFACESPLKNAVDFNSTMRFTPDTAKPDDYFDMIMNGSTSATMIHYQSSPKAVITYSVYFSRRQGRSDITYRLRSIENIQDKLIMKEGGFFGKDGEQIILKENIPDEIKYLIGDSGYRSSNSVYYSSDSFKIYGFKFLQFYELPRLKTVDSNRKVKIDGKDAVITTKKTVVVPGRRNEAEIYAALFSR